MDHYVAEKAALIVHVNVPDPDVGRPGGGAGTVLKSTSDIRPKKKKRKEIHTANAACFSFLPLHVGTPQRYLRSYLTCFFAFLIFFFLLTRTTHHSSMILHETSKQENSELSYGHI